MAALLRPLFASLREQAVGCLDRHSDKINEFPSILISILSHYNINEGEIAREDL